MSYSYRNLLVVQVIAGLAMISAPVFAQLPQARLDWIFPTGLQSGSSANIQLSGADLEGTTRLWFSHPGFSAKPGPDGRWTVNAGKEVPAGIYELMAVGGWGMTNPVPIIVGPIGEIVETEPNHPVPQKITMPVTVQGQIQSPADVDIFAFEGRKDQRVVIDLKAEVLDSPLDGTLRLMGPTGLLVDENLDTTGYDPYLELKLPETGLYQLHVYDAVYGGSAAHRYRLTIHDGPVVDATLPLAVEPGQSPQLKLFGRGFNAGPDANYQPIYTFPEESIGTLFKSVPTQDLFQRRPNDSNAEAPTRFWLNTVGESGRVLPTPVAVAIAEAPVVIETESNNAPENAQKITVPSDFSGIFQKPGDVDYISFDAQKDQTWVIQTVAARQDSKATPEVSILKRNADGSVAVIAELAEQLANPFGPSFETATIDRGITWKAPADGNYLIKLNDFNRDAGDARYYYRLIIRSLKPDFQLIAIPAAATNATGETFIKGSRSVIKVLINRHDGFDLPVRVVAEGLPQGVRAYPIVLSPGQSSQNMVFEVAGDAVPGEFPLRLKGETHWSDQKESIDWVPGQKIEPEFTSNFNSLGGGLIRPLVGPPNQQRGLSRYQRNLMIAIRETPSPFELEPVPQRLFLKRGTESELEMQLKKNNGFDDKVTLRLDNLPANMDAVAGEIPKGQTTVKLKCKIGANVALGRHTVYINGTAPFAFDKNPDGKNKKNITWNIPSRPVTLIVTP